ncbi:MAG: hypothetical protein ACE149_16605 [Armatimonadota bacterium]
MSASDFSLTEPPIEPLVGRASLLDGAAETMLSASRTMLSAAMALSSGLGVSGARERELTAEAVEVGVVRALRRDTLLGGSDSAGEPLLLRSSSSAGISGTGYGRMGASVTGQGARSQLYGTIGGALGYAVGGPVGAVLGGMLGGFFGRDDDDEAAQQQLERQWLNPPEYFEIESYLHNLQQAYAASASSGWRRGSSQGSAAASGRGGYALGRQVVVNMSPGAVQITGQGEESGERAARAFAGALGRVLRLNSVVVPAAGLGGDI